MSLLSGYLRKLITSYNSHTCEVTYQLDLDDKSVLELNQLVGKEIRIEFLGEIRCVHCGRSISKTYNDGYCYPCFISLARCDACITRPHMCHFSRGTCRDGSFAKENCFKPHVLYLARTSHIKIGITKKNNCMHRWMDQGAQEAAAIGEFEDRLSVGIAEEKISHSIRDKTDWRKMLKNEASDKLFEPYVDLAQKALSSKEKKYLYKIKEKFAFKYPVLDHPKKIASLKLEKLRKVSGILTGIKGQYLMFGDKVLNIRSHAGYGIKFSC